MIPLYLKQDQSFGDDPTSSSAVSRRANDDVPAPSAVMAYPPLAYFLNSILNGLNFLRECPMLSAKDALLGELISVLIDSCSFFVGLSSDVCVRGAKYLPQGGVQNKNTRRGSETVNENGNGNGNGNGEKEKNIGLLPMDKQYAIMLAEELLPHVLLCFEHIFVCQLPNTVTQSSTKSLSLKNIQPIEIGSKGRGKNVSLKVLTLSSARGSMSPVSYTALSTCWNMFRTADLIPQEKVPVPVPISVLSASKSTSSILQNEIETKVEVKVKVEVEVEVPIVAEKELHSSSTENPTDFDSSLIIDKNQSDFVNDVSSSDVILEDIYKNAADDISGNVTVVRLDVLKKS